MIAVIFDTDEDVKIPEIDYSFYGNSLYEVELWKKKSWKCVFQPITFSCIKE